MTNAEKIIKCLKRFPEGIDDDDLAFQTHISHRQTVNRICRDLADEGLVKRKKKSGKIHNYWIGDNEASSNWESGDIPLFGWRAKDPCKDERIQVSEAQRILLDFALRVNSDSINFKDNISQIV